MNLEQWLTANGLGKYKELFADSDIDLDVLPHLTESDIASLNLPIGARRRLETAIELLRENRVDLADHAESVRHQAERRQLTVMFCDLVGSTSLSQRLDPEALRNLMGGYQHGCKVVIEKYEGHIAQYLGDGVMVYFGWPRAHEDDAERAARAALEIVEKIRKSDQSDVLHVRIGIATGAVVVGETKDAEHALPKLAVGETPNLAARLQALAGVDEIVMGSKTRRLAGAAISVEDMGEHVLKGIVEPVQAWRLTGLGAGRSRLRHSPDSGGLTRFVGRDSELGLLLDRWEQSREGEGQVVLVCGEPGIGKSRLVETLKESVGPDQCFRMRYQCSPYHASTALHPVVEQLRHATKFSRDDSDGQRLAKLASLLAVAKDDIEYAVPLIASLMSIAYEETYPRLTVPPQKQKDLTLQALKDQIIGLSQKKPVLMILEDAHWLDPTSQELFNLMMPEIADRPVLLVVTFRPEYQPTWQGLSHVTPMTLNRLPRRQARAIVESVCTTDLLTIDVVEEIVAKTDGVPLFLEELTKAVMESGEETRESGTSLFEAGSGIEIPSTLRDSLMARLDRLDVAKDIAQVGACIGREFTLDIVAAVSGVDDDTLFRLTERLVNSGLVYRRKGLDATAYVFKHALVQEAAYASLLHSRRQMIHGEIAAALVRLSPEGDVARPEVLAHHYWHANQVEEAIANWLSAGRKAVQRAANVEAIAHLESALGALPQLPNTSELAQLELSIRTLLGPAYQAVKGWGSQEAGDNYERARVLCQQQANVREAFIAMWGVWMYRMGGTGSVISLELVEELQQLSERERSVELELQANHAAWTSKIWNGQLTEGLEHARKGLAVYDINEHRNHATRYGGHDPGVCGWGQAALAHWLLGQADQAIDMVDKGLALARQLEHPPSIAHALLWDCFVYHASRDPEKVLVYSDELEKVGAENGLVLYSILGGVIGGWARSMLGNPAEGSKRGRHWASRYMAVQTRMSVAYVHSTYAEILMMNGEYEDAAHAFSSAETLGAKTGDRFWDPEVMRLRGEFLLRGDTPDVVASEKKFRDAIDLAHKMKAKSLELRAAISLAKLWHERGKTEAARRILAPILGEFTEGFGTRDLGDARALLEKLGA